MKNRYKILLGTVALTTQLFAGSGCWTTEHKAILESAELEGNIIFSFKDSKDCTPITNAKVTFAGKQFTTDYNGYLTLPIPPENIDMQIPLKVEKDGYITLKQNVMASVGSFWQNKFIMTKEIPIKSAKFILGWGESPKDLDLHLVSDDFHISYRNKTGAVYKAKLDRDSTQGYGPETITLDLLDKHKSYKVYVYKFSTYGEFDHSVNFSLYKNNKLDKSFSFPSNLHSRCVQVATIFNNTVKYDIKEVSSSKCRGK